jgi:hypothetical protein
VLLEHFVAAHAVVGWRGHPLGVLVDLRPKGTQLGLLVFILLVYFLLNFSSELRESLLYLFFGECMSVELVNMLVALFTQ